ncbi:MAG: bifunctional YncE family protein/alkaline phosphatase family protein [Armatimonadota bacterium]
MRWLPGVLACFVLSPYSTVLVPPAYADAPAPPAPKAKAIDADDDDGDIDADDPANEERFNRELWESIRRTPYSLALAHINRKRAAAKPNLAAANAAIELPTGWKIAPAGISVEVGRFPYEAIAYGDRIVVLNTGYYTGTSKPEVSLVDPTTGTVRASLFFDALFPSAQIGMDGDLYISGGISKKVFRLNKRFQTVRTYTATAGYMGGIAPLNATHIVVASLVAAPTADDFDKGKYQQGKLSILNTETGMVEKEVETGYFPQTIRIVNNKLYAAILGENTVHVYDLALQRQKILTVGNAPQDIAVDGSRLYVVNQNSDSVSVIDTTSDTVTETIDLNANGTRHGGAPTSCAVDGDRLYVTLANINAVAVLDRVSHKVLGYMPTGWYPTKVLADTNNLYLLSAKGIRPRKANKFGPQPTGDARSGPDYVLTLLKGSLSTVPKTGIGDSLPAWTRQVQEGSPLFSPAGAAKLPIKYVFYIVRENRTYDQVLGDLPRANGDPYLTLFGRDVTPNAHRLSEQFVTLDNYYADGEISVLGHSFTTSGYASPFLEWLGNAAYSGKYKGYPFGMVPAATSPAYLWDALDARKVDYRIYGENYFLYTRGFKLISEEFGPDSDLAKKFYRQMMTLASQTDRGRAYYDFASSYYGHAATPEAAETLLAKPDFAEKLSQFLCGDATLAAALAERPVLRRKFAEYLYRYPSNYRSWDMTVSDMTRFQAWKTDFDAQIKRGKVANLQYLWLPNDHTAGATGKPLNPTQFVAQNDAALGRIVETIAHSPIWKESLILVTEDDAQNGPDHVDATRTIALAIGPNVKRNTVISDRYDQLSLLRTIEVVLGLDPMNRSDALAVPFLSVLTDKRDERKPEKPIASPHLADSDRELFQKTAR